MSEPGKRVSWVELYLDLVFVLAVGQSVWIALGLFVTLWWTWVGFTVLYNRHGDDEPALRLLFLAGSVPAGIAAVAIAPAAEGDAAVFALSMAAIRLVLAAGYAAGGDRASMLQRRIMQACVASAALFAVSAALPGPFRAILWAIAIVVESSAMLDEDREAMDRLRRDRDFAALARRTRRTRSRPTTSPSDSGCS